MNFQNVLNRAILHTFNCSNNANHLTYHIVGQMSMCWVYAVWFEVLLVQLLAFLAPEHGLHCTLYSFHLKAYLLLRLLVRCISYIVAPLC